MMNQLPAAKPVLSTTAREETWTLRSFSLIVFSTQALVVSFFPLYFLASGFTESHIGILYSAGLFISVFANMLTGFVSDKYRTIRKIIIVALFGQLAMVSLLFPASSFAAIVAIMIAFYFFQTPMNPLSDSLILLSTRHTGTPYALIRIFGSAGFAISAYSFGLLLKAIGSEWTLPLALITISLSLIISFFLKDYQGKTQKIQFSGFFNLMKQRHVLLFFVVIALISISHRMYESFLAVTMKQIGASDSTVGLAFLISATSEIPVLFLLGKYGSRFKELPLLMLASLMYALRMWLMGQISDPRWILATQAMHSVSFGIYFATTLRLISRLIPDQFRASGQAIYTIVWTGVAGLIGGGLGGLLYEQYGKAAFYNTATSIALVAFVGFMLYAFRYAGKKI